MPVFKEAYIPFVSQAALYIPGRRFRRGVGGVLARGGVNHYVQGSPFGAAERKPVLPVSAGVLKALGGVQPETPGRGDQGRGAGNEGNQIKEKGENLF
jgi:hypothetical protein